MYQNIQYDQLYHEAEVLAAVDHFIQEVCLGSYDLYHQNLMIDLQKLVQSFKPIYNANFFYCNTVQIFIEVVNIVDHTLRLMPQADHDCIVCFDDMTVRIEQRIGRCHRYGQKHDVVVVNFVDRSNEADSRVYDLLSEKFQLFDGVFGASDEILGTIGSGVDFEKRIAEIYQECRDPEEIAQSFESLQNELSAEIDHCTRTRFWRSCYFKNGSF